MAQETVDEAVKVFGFKSLYGEEVGKCVTERVRLVGSEGWGKNMFIGLVQRVSLLYHHLSSLHLLFELHAHADT